MVPFLLVVIAAGFLGSYIVVRSVTTSFDERFENQLAEASRVAADSLVRREQQHLETLRNVIFTEGFAPSLRARDAADLRAVVLPIAANDGIELVEVLNADGRPLVSLGQDADGALATVSAAGIGEWTIVRDVLGGSADRLGDRYAQIAPGPNGPAIYTAAPVTYGGVVVGAVIVGSSLPQVLPEVKAAALADVTYLGASGGALATTFAQPTPEDWSALSVPGPITGLRRSVIVAGRSYEVLLTDLRVRGERVGFTAVALPRDFVALAQGRTARRLGLLMGGGALAMLGTGWLVSRSLTLPLARLVRATRAVRAGDLTSRSGVQREDEIGDLAVSFDHMTEELQRTHLGTLEALVSAIDARDTYTRGHSVRVGHLARFIGQELGLPSADQQHLLVGGYLHDIGKIGIRDAVLLKPSGLTPEERGVIEEHPTIGLAILEPVGLPAEALLAIGQHHERLDGSGYPLGLRGDEVSIHARIVTVADVYDALITDRPYRSAMSREDVFAVLEEEAQRGRIDGEAVAALARIERHWTARRQADPTLQGFRLNADLVRPLRTQEQVA